MNVLVEKIVMWTANNYEMWRKNQAYQGMMKPNSMFKLSFKIIVFILLAISRKKYDNEL